MEMECGHEVTGGYVYTGDQAGSRNMRVTLRRLQVEGPDVLWATVLDPEDMECELTIVGLGRERLLRWLLRSPDAEAAAREQAELLVERQVARLIDWMLSTSTLGGAATERVAAERAARAEALVALAMDALGMSHDEADGWVAEAVESEMGGRG